MAWLRQVTPSIERQNARGRCRSTVEIAQYPTHSVGIRGVLHKFQGCRIRKRGIALWARCSMLHAVSLFGARFAADIH